MPQRHDVRAIVERELSQMDWSRKMSKARLVEHFRMAPTVRKMLEAKLPDRPLDSAEAVLRAISETDWQRLEDTIKHGTPESHFLQALPAKPGGQQSPA